MGEAAQGQGQLKPQPRFSREQYDVLVRGSTAKDMTEWNAWREANPLAPVLLEGADLKRAYLERANLGAAHLESADLRFSRLENAHLSRAHLEHANLFEACLEGADLWDACLQRADLKGAHMENTLLNAAHLEGADLKAAHLEKANLMGARLADADLKGAHLTDAFLSGANLDSADLMGAFLQNAELYRAHLANVDLDIADLRGARFNEATVDGNTLISGCRVDRRTDFTGVGLDSARVEPGLRQLLDYNVRRLGWIEWYKRHRFLAGPMWLFWRVSDYGRSGKRVLGSFFGFALAFAVAYSLRPSMITDLEVPGREQVPVFVRAVYFSLVTMTTLGFGDMHAAPDSWGGHILLTVQVFLGYVLLAALVTRLAILFTSGGPPADFPKDGRP